MAGLCGLSGTVGNLLFNFVVVCAPVPFWNEVRVSYVPLCFVKSFRRSRGGGSAFRIPVGHSWEEGFSLSGCER